MSVDIEQPENAHKYLTAIGEAYIQGLISNPTTKPAAVSVAHDLRIALNALAPKPKKQRSVGKRKGSA